MRIVLAPMEGVVDYGMREILTRIGGYDRCVTEFVRVNEQVLPNHIFLRFAPELEHGGHTKSGVPVYLQLLGGNAKSMALNAAKAQRLEPPGIDLNFGCPSKKVTKSDGGSALLREPKRIADIVASVRDAVDPKIPVTAKMRLGFSNYDYLEEIATNIKNAGATELCIHARTREDRYKAPAYWSAVKQVSDRVSIPIIINGEIWNHEDSQRALLDSGCSNIMLGRGALSCPDLGLLIKAQEAGLPYSELDWWQVLELMMSYLRKFEHQHPLFVGNRCKQWLGFLQRQYPLSADLFHRVKRLKQAQDVFDEVYKYQQEGLGLMMSA